MTQKENSLFSRLSKLVQPIVSVGRLVVRKVRKLFSKLPLLAQYILSSFFLWVVIVGVAAALAYAALSIFGVYETLENKLDLKAGSPWIMVPVYAGAIGAVLCILIGSLMFFHKYKRSKPRSKFHHAFSSVMTKEQKLLKDKK